MRQVAGCAQRCRSVTSHALRRISSLSIYAGTVSSEHLLGHRMPLSRGGTLDLVQALRLEKAGLSPRDLES